MFRLSSKTRGEKSSHVYYTLKHRKPDKSSVFSCAQMTCPTWSVPYTLSLNSPLWLMVSQCTVYKLTIPYFWRIRDVFVSHASPPGCKVDMFDLKVEAVNTHRDRPLVSFSFIIFIALTCSLFLSRSALCIHGHCSACVQHTQLEPLRGRPRL